MTADFSSPAASFSAPPFSRIRFVMTQPSLPANVGAAARAIKTMGFGDLVLVAPKTPEVTTHPDALALASGAGDVLDAAQVVETLADALAPVTLAFALTARPRDLGPPACDIRAAAEAGRQHLHEYPDARVAIVVGTERAGLTNADIARCQRICHIPANPAYSSLNVAQALQLAAWELRYALLDGENGENGENGEGQAAPAARQPGDAPAENQSVQALIAHLQDALIAVDFLDPQHPKKLMPRLHHLFNRASLTRDEVAMLRGVCTAMVRTAKQSPSTSPSTSGNQP